jgi:hypothetical protein
VKYMPERFFVVLVRALGQATIGGERRQRSG